MPTVFDTKFRALARKLVAKFGVSAGTYSRYIGGAMDDDTNTITNGVDSQPLPMSPPLKYKKSDIDGETIMASDNYVIVAAPDWEDVFTNAVFPSTNDTITINTEVFAVMNPDRIYSGEQVAAYKIQLRKGSA